jgi:predicted metal-dependent HD superfamily phosphohydrolase
MGRLWRRWRAFWAVSGAGGDARGAFDALDARYREPHRSYHGWGHILACLEELDSVRALCANPVAVELGLWYHDAVYDPRARDNERRSAALAREAGIGMGLAEGTVSEAEALILATAHTGRAAGERHAAPDERIILDIDLAILGSAPRRFAAYGRAIRAEYSFLADSEYAEGRTAVLQSLLARPRIYLTDAFGKRLESLARENIRAGLGRLAGQSM